jgi:hypothetical protein
MPRTARTCKIRVRVSHRSSRALTVNCHLAGHGIIIKARISRKTRRTCTARVRVSRHSAASGLRIQARMAQHGPLRPLQVHCLVSNEGPYQGITITAKVTKPLYTAWLVTDIVYTSDDSDSHNARDRVARNKLPPAVVLYVDRETTPAVQVIEQMLIDQITQYTGWHVLGATFYDMTGATKLYAGTTKPLRSHDPA